jgi:predicted enzyme related to lactoylglutathione lyase
MAKAKAKTKHVGKPAAKVTKGSQRGAKKPAATATRAAATRSTAPVGPVLRSLRSHIFQVDDLARAKTFYGAALGRAPYFDQPFYVGFDVDGQELGLDPDVSKRRSGAGGGVGYWRVDDIAASWDLLLALGGRSIEPPHGVGGDMQVAIVADPFGNLLGLISGAN